MPLREDDALFHSAPSLEALLEDLFGLERTSQLAGQVDTATLKARLQNLVSSDHALCKRTAALHAAVKSLFRLLAADKPARRRRWFETALLDQAGVHDLLRFLRTRFGTTATGHACLEGLLG